MADKSETPQRSASEVVELTPAPPSPAEQAFVVELQEWESTQPQVERPTRNRPVGLTVYALLNLAVAALGVLGALAALVHLARMDPQVREGVGQLGFGWIYYMYGLAMSSALLGASAGLLKGARWGRTLLLWYAVVWLLGRVTEGAFLVEQEILPTEEVGDTAGTELAKLLVISLLGLTWFLLPCAIAEWRSFLSAEDSPDLESW